MTGHFLSHCELLIKGRIRFQGGFRFEMFFCLNEKLGFEPVLQCSSFRASIGKVKVISEGFDHSLFA